MMEPTRLLTRDGRHVVTVSLPPFSPPAEAVYWGQRFFMRDAAGEYREGLCFFVPTGAEVTAP
jgi:hypothetical protein